MTHLEVKVEDRGEVALLKLEGFLDAHNHQLFRTALEGCVTGGKRKIVVDFKALAYIGSSGIEVILARIQTLRDQGGDILLAGMSPKIFKVFDLLGLPSFFKILPTAEEALAEAAK